MKTRIIRQEIDNPYNSNQKLVAWVLQIETSLLWGLIKYWRKHASFWSKEAALSYHKENFTGPDIVEV